MLDTKRFLVPKSVGFQKKFKVLKKLGSRKSSGSKKFLVMKNFGSWFRTPEKNWMLWKNLISKKIWVPKILYFPDTFQTPSRHLPDTLQTPSRHPPVGCDDFDFFPSIFLGIGTYSTVTVRWTMVPLKNPFVAGKVQHKFSLWCEKITKGGISQNYKFLQ